MNEGRFWAWRPWSQAQSGDVSLHPPCADTACKYTAWQMAWLCSSPPTNLWQAGLMPERLADRPCLIHCHKRHIVYRTERHCNTNTNTPRVGDTLGKPLVCGSRVGLKESIAMRSLLQLLIEKCELYCDPTCISCWSISFLYPNLFPALLRSLQKPCSSYIRHSLTVHVSFPPNVCVALWLQSYIFTIANVFSCSSQKDVLSGKVRLMRTHSISISLCVFVSHLAITPNIMLILVVR